MALKKEAVVLLDGIRVRVVLVEEGQGRAVSILCLITILLVFQSNYFLHLLNGKCGLQSHIWVHVCPCDMWLDSAGGKAFPMLTFGRGPLWETILWPMCLLLEDVSLARSAPTWGGLWALPILQHFPPALFFPLHLGHFYSEPLTALEHMRKAIISSNIPRELFSGTAVGTLAQETAQETHRSWVYAKNPKTLVWAPFCMLVILRSYERYLVLWASALFSRE